MSKMGPRWSAIFDNLTLIHNAMGPIPPACNIPQRHWQKVGQRCRGGIGQVPGFYETHAGAGAHLYVNLTIGANPFMSFLV